MTSLVGRLRSWHEPPSPPSAAFLDETAQLAILTQARQEEVNRRIMEVQARVLQSRPIPRRAIQSEENDDAP